ncbi:MAG: MFS transporter [Blastocatellia bacterium]
MNDPQPRLIPYRWELIILLWLAFFFNQADRQIFNVVLPLIREDLKLTDVQLGLIASVFTWTLGMLIPFAGYAGDVLRRKWIIVASLLIWSSATLFTGFSSGMIHLLLFRGVTAGGEAFYAPSANALIGEHHHRTRAQALAIHQTSLYAGVIASGLVAGWIGERYGWPAAFYSFGLLGVALAVIAAFRMQDRSAREQDRHDEERIALTASLRAVFQKPTAVLLTLAFTGVVFVNVGYLTWMPAFLHEKFRLTLPQAGFSSMFFHHVAAFAGVLASGRISDLWAPKREPVRLELECAGLLLGAPFIYLMGAADELILVFVALAGFGLMRGVYDANIYAALFDVIEPKFRSSAAGIMASFAFLAGASAPLLLGWVKGRFGLDIGLSLLSIVYLLSAAAVFAARRVYFTRDYYREAPMPLRV